MADLLAAESLEKSYGSTRALDGVTLDVGAGEVYALVGPNGAGKTTLVQCLTGTVTPDAGTVTVFGTRPADADAARVGYLPQDFKPHDRLTARELLEYYAGLYRDPQDVDTILDDVGMAAAADTRYEALSGGQQRRVCVGTTLLNDPDLLFLDEPTTGIDPVGRQDLWDLVESLTDTGTTVFLTTHYMAEAEYLADRVGLLSDGTIVDSGPPAALIEEYGGEAHLEIDLSTPLASGDLDEIDLPTAVDDGTLVVGDVTPGDIGSVIRALEAAGTEYGDVTWTQPSLEDVYLELTGNAEQSLAAATVEVAQ